MNSLVEIQRNADGGLTMNIAPALSDVFVSGVLQAANELQIQYSQPQTDAAPLSASARLLYGGRMKISPEELCESVGISRRTVSNWQSRRIIPFYKVGRRVLFDVAEVEEALKRYRCTAIGEPRRRMGRIP